MTRTFDVAIAGLGVMGSAAAAELARRGLRVLGLDRFTPPHALGSSHGESRIIREAYFEHPAYVPLVQRAYTLWRRLEQQAATPLLLETGGLMIGAADSELVAGARRSAEIHRLPHSVLTAAEVRERFPALSPDDDMVAVWEPRAGVLLVEACVTAQLTQAAGAGADLRYAEPVVEWSAKSDAVRVLTAKGEYRARRLIISAGAWLSDLLADDKAQFSIERQVLHWFAPLRHSGSFDPRQLPIHLWQLDGGRFFYGFPDIGSGIKAGFHHDGAETTADDVARDVSAEEVDIVRTALRDFVPDADGVLRASRVCLYTNTRDGHFLIDYMPDEPRVIVASACSGHGFKFAPVIGDVLADLVQGVRPTLDLSLFGWR